MHWTDKEAQENFNELLDKVDSEGPQLIRRGDQEYWVMNWEQWDRLEKKEATPNRKLVIKPESC